MIIGCPHITLSENFEKFAPIFQLFQQACVQALSVLPWIQAGNPCHGLSWLPRRWPTMKPVSGAHEHASRLQAVKPFTYTHLTVMLVGINTSPVYAIVNVGSATNAIGRLRRRRKIRFTRNFNEKFDLQETSVKNLIYKKFQWKILFTRNFSEKFYLQDTSVKNLIYKKLQWKIWSTSTFGEKFDLQETSVKNLIYKKLQ